MNITRWKKAMFGILALFVAITLGLTFVLGSAPKTPGEQFRIVIENIESACASRTLGPNERCGEVAKLIPADQMATPEGQFAHSIRLPEPLPENSGYREGMTPQEYFEHLCETEAGEFVYKVVKDVESVYMMRPRIPATDNELKHLYVLEDPYGSVSGEYGDPREFVQPDLGRYRRLELPYASSSGAETTARIKVFFRDDVRNSRRKHQTARGGRMLFVPYVVSERASTVRSSRYGFTWRGITRIRDRDMGIAGGELILMNLQNDEVLAVRRGFIRTGSSKSSPTGVWWLTGETCPQLSSRPNRFFIYDVLIPAKLPELGESS